MRPLLRIVTFVGGLGGGGAVGVGVLAGPLARFAESRCEPRPNELFPCLADALAGAFWGVLIGVVAGALAWQFLWRLWTRSRRAPYSTSYLIAATGLVLLSGAGCVVLVSLLAAAPVAGLVVLVGIALVVLGRGVRRDLAELQTTRHDPGTGPAPMRDRHDDD